MNRSTPAWMKSREISTRVIIEGDLVLETPAHFGGEAADAWSDMPLALDALEGHALLTGASLAGALRNYLFKRSGGSDESLGKLLFGYQERQEHKEDGEQSYLVVCDTLAGPPHVERRDGVAINAVTRTAIDERKFDMELLAAGTTFPIRLELALPASRKLLLLEAMAIALQGLERGEIPLGGRKRRGLGRCRVSTWRVRSYDLLSTSGLLGWLEDDQQRAQTGSDIAALLGVKNATRDQRCWFRIETTLALASPLMIRSSTGTPDAPDLVHLHSPRPGAEKDVPVLSGTSLAGAIRARAGRIARTVGVADPKALLEAMFGSDLAEQDREQEKVLKAGKLWIHESEIQAKELDWEKNWRQNRVKIDRFTGGSYPAALFDEQPLFPVEQAYCTLILHLEKPEPAQIGLLLLVLKDLWTGDLPLGGESSVGRGRLKGLSAHISYRPGPDKPLEEWSLGAAPKDGADGSDLQITGDQNRLEKFVRALVGGQHAG